MGFEQAELGEIQNIKEHYKNMLIKKGEATVYGELRKHYPSGSIYKVMTLREFVEMLKAEVQQEETQTKNK